MAGAGEGTRRVRVVNANWTPGPDGTDGSFALLLVTEDDERHELSPSPAAFTALLALSQAGTVLLFDPAERTVIAANVVGDWLPESWSALGRPGAGLGP